MISTKHRFIYVHIPKTGGNSLQSLLLPHSDDHKAVYKQLDGAEDFEVLGVTPNKHASLSEYEEVLGTGALDAYFVFTTVRNPWDRAMSLYFSPHRWFVRRFAPWRSISRRPGAKAPTIKGRIRDLLFRFEAVEPEWDRHAFLQLVRSMSPMADFFRVRGRLRLPDRVVRFENFEADARVVLAELNLPLANHQIPHLNKSRHTAFREYYDEELLAAVEHRFAEDLEVFDYKRDHVLGT